MDQIILQLKEREILENRLISCVFEMLGGSSTDHVRIRELLSPAQNRTCLVRVDIGGEIHYLKEAELANDRIGVYRLNHDLADLQLVGEVTGPSIRFLDGRPNIRLDDEFVD